MYKILLTTALFLIAGCVEVTNFEECVARGNPVMESHPRQCEHGGEVFIEEINKNITSFEECVEAGYEVMDSDPRKCSYDGETFVEEIEDEYKACEEIGGDALPKFGECEGINESVCEDLNGEFLECESACRNENSEICTMQCVQVCELE